MTPPDQPVGFGGTSDRLAGPGDQHLGRTLRIPAERDPATHSVVVDSAIAAFPEVETRSIEPSAQKSQTPDRYSRWVAIPDHREIGVDPCAGPAGKLDDANRATADDRHRRGLPSVRNFDAACQMQIRRTTDPAIFADDRSQLVCSRGEARTWKNGIVAQRLFEKGLRLHLPADEQKTFDQKSDGIRAISLARCQLQTLDRRVRLSSFQEELAPQIGNIWISAATRPTRSMKRSAAATSPLR